MRRIANDLQVKKALIKYIGNDCVPNIPPHVTLNDFSTLDLCKLILKAKHGYLLWKSDAQVNPTKEYRIPLGSDAPNPMPNAGPYGQYRLKVLPGGDYVMYQARLGHLQCRRVSTGEVITSYPLSTDELPVSDLNKLDAFNSSLLRKDDGQLYLVVVALISCTVEGTLQR